MYQKDPSDVSKQSIKLSNAFIRRSVLNVIGGVELLCFGPGGFQLRSGAYANNQTLQIESCLHKIIRSDDRGNLKYLCKDWITRYVRFLKSFS
jgi:hypothetical protein